MVVRQLRWQETTLVAHPFAKAPVQIAAVFLPVEG